MVWSAFCAFTYICWQTTAVIKETFDGFYICFWLFWMPLPIENLADFETSSVISFLGAKSVKAEEKFRLAIKNQRSGILSKEIVLIYDNVYPHRANQTPNLISLKTSQSSSSGNQWPLRVAAFEEVCGWLRPQRQWRRPKSLISVAGKTRERLKWGLHSRADYTVG